ncbi:MAG: class I SAM-dependent methyltransferase [Burkholderiaceae bacterium]|nr:class I SAM-dependent methyltransferase [Burkholderiaceae bacterium]
MPQNVYDDPQFFEGYRRLREDGPALNEALEQPALDSLLPPSLAGLRVLDVGCGFGGFARHACVAGAAQVVGVDISSRMLEVARARTPVRLPIQYRRQALETLEAEEDDEVFDLVVSSLALHYVADYPAALARIAALMAPGARLAFSVEHPIATAVATQQWHRDAAGRESHWPVDGYQDEGPRHTHWFIDGVIKHHRTVQTLLDGVAGAGLRFARLLEPVPSADDMARQPWLASQRRRPSFLLIAADKPAQ